MKLITFLGTGNYQPTTYVFGAQDCMTRFFPVAAAQFTQPTQTLVCVTPTVEKHAGGPPAIARSMSHPAPSLAGVQPPASKPGYSVIPPSTNRLAPVM